MPFFVLEVKRMKKKEYKNIKDWIPIKNIRDDTIYLKNNTAVKLFKINPINFHLKTDTEKIITLEKYKRFLKAYSYDVQIIIQTDRVDIEKHLMAMEDFKNKEPELSPMVSDYIEHLQSILLKKENVSRKFYLVSFSKNCEKLRSAFSNVDNDIIECSNDEIIKVLGRYFKKYTMIRKEQKWV